MTIATGRRIGAYEIQSLLGSGGMGEVYRARDTALNRDAALKMLPHEVSDDSQKLARFRREAQTLASLNHPNIAQIYGLVEDGSVLALAMEFVEGEELGRKMEREALSLEEAIPVARQIAEALEAAHEKGIVHRDLKPANIKITPAGQVKLLDFGLAMALSEEISPVSSGDIKVSQSPTRTRMTEEGMILGTAAYMSPEQARGKKVDKRADIWSFGVVLFEMLFGRRLFAGETISDTLAAVLRQEIDWTLLPAYTPREIRHLLRRCLERDPNLRLRDIGEARIMLNQPPEREAPALQAKRSAPLAYWIALPVVLIAAFFIGRFATKAPGQISTAPQPKSFALLTDQPGVETQPRLSPDGKTLAFVKDNNGQLDIYVVRVGGRNAVNLTADSNVDDQWPAFSPDGQSIAFRSERSGGGIFVMGSTGESVRRISDFGYSPSWSPDGSKIVVSSASFIYPQDRNKFGVLYTIDAQTGSKHQLADTSIDVIQPSWSPHGKRIAYWGLRANSGQRDIWTIAADGSEFKTGGIPVTHDSALDWSPTWSPDGNYLYISSNRGGTLNLWRIPIDESTGRTLGEPQPVTVPSNWAGYPCFSQDGKLAYASLEWRSRLLRVPFDPDAAKITGGAIPILESSYPIRDHSISPDGNWIAYNAYVGGNEDLFVMRIDGTEIRRLTEDPYRDRAPAWFPDGQRIAFYSDRSGSYEIWTIRADGSGLQQMTHSGGGLNLPIFSPDGKKMTVVDLQRGWWIVSTANPVFSQKNLQPPVSSQFSFWPFSWSPDANQILGILLDTGGTLRGFASYSISDSKYKIYTSPEISGSWGTGAWLADSRRFLFRDRRGISLWDFGAQAPQLILPVTGYFIARSFNTTADNRILTYTETATQGDIWQMEFNSRSSKANR
jgi:eukaryotic-like serine/threonine-protein kinase